MKKKLTPLRIEDADETGATFVFQVSAATASKFDDPGQWCFAIFENGRWELNVGCLPESLDNILSDEFDSVGLVIAEFECKDFQNL